MCDCGQKVVNYTHLNIYTLMAKYKAVKSSGTLYKGDFKIKWATATQEEELGMTKVIEKTSTIKTKDEPKKESKRSSKNKSSDSKE